VSIAEIAGRHDTATGYLRPAEQADSGWMHSLLLNEEYAFFAVRREHSRAEVASEVAADIGSPVTALFIIMQEDDRAGCAASTRGTPGLPPSCRSPGS
jgi:hypothetical protein